MYVSCVGVECACTLREFQRNGAVGNHTFALLHTCEYLHIFSVVRTDGDEAFLEGHFGVEAVVVLLYTFRTYRIDSRVVLFIEELHSAQLLRCLVDEVCRPVVLSVS